MITLTEKRFFEWHEDTISVTLRYCGGSYGGGTETLIVEQDDDISESNGFTTCEWVQQTRNARSDERDVHNGEKKCGTE